MPATPELTTLLHRYQHGDQEALDALATAVYPELKAMARRRSSASPMNATTLVQEAFSRFMALKAVKAEDRRQFFALAATIMRRVIVDDVRSAMSLKRAASISEQEPDQIADQLEVDNTFLLAVDEALSALASRDSQLAAVFECRFFAGYTIAETAAVLKLSNRSAERLWQESRQRLAKLLGD